MHLFSTAYQEEEKYTLHIVLHFQSFRSSTWSPSKTTPVAARPRCEWIGHFYPRRSRQVLELWKLFLSLGGEQFDEQYLARY